MMSSSRRARLAQVVVVVTAMMFATTAVADAAGGSCTSVKVVNGVTLQACVAGGSPVTGTSALYINSDGLAWATGHLKGGNFDAVIGYSVFDPPGTRYGLPTTTCSITDGHVGTYYCPAKSVPNDPPVRTYFERAHVYEFDGVLAGKTDSGSINT